MSFQKNVIESFRKAKEDMIRMNTALEYMADEQRKLTSIVEKLSERQTVLEERVRNLKK